MFTSKECTHITHRHFRVEKHISSEFIGYDIYSLKSRKWEEGGKGTQVKTIR